MTSIVWRGFKIKVLRAPPTKRHRLLIVPGLFGTVYAVSPSGECRFFRYDRDAAYLFARLDPLADIRVGVPAERRSYISSGCTWANPGSRVRCLWIGPAPPKRRSTRRR